MGSINNNLMLFNQLSLEEKKDKVLLMLNELKDYSETIKELYEVISKTEDLNELSTDLDNIYKLLLESIEEIKTNKVTEKIDTFIKNSDIIAKFKEKERLEKEQEIAELKNLDMDF